MQRVAERVQNEGSDRVGVGVGQLGNELRRFTMSRWLVPPSRREKSRREGSAASTSRAPRTHFVADPDSDRRHNMTQREIVEAVLAELHDPIEREAYLREVRGQSV